jgi:hypothetical protein
MDEVFDSGLPAWKAVPKGSRLDQIQKDIEAGNLKVSAPFGGAQARESEKDIEAGSLESPVPSGGAQARESEKTAAQTTETAA